MSAEAGSDWRSEHDRSAQRADALQSARPRAAGGSLPQLGAGEGAWGWFVVRMAFGRAT